MPRDWGMTLERSVADAHVEALHEDSPDPEIVVHRDVEGPHVQSLECWCEPLLFDCRFFTITEIVEIVKRKSRRH